MHVIVCNSSGIKRETLFSLKWSSIAEIFSRRRAATTDRSVSVRRAPPRLPSEKYSLAGNWAVSLAQVSSRDIVVTAAATGTLNRSVANMGDKAGKKQNCGTILYDSDTSSSFSNPLRWESQWGVRFREYHGNLSKRRQSMEYVVKTSRCIATQFAGKQRNFA